MNELTLPIHNIHTSHSIHYTIYNTHTLTHSTRL